MMKAVILCGGMGTRLSEETSTKPKPMVEIGGMPILFHIMDIYSYYGIKEFVIALGYKGHYIKEYFLNYIRFHNDFTINLKDDTIKIINTNPKDWIIHFVDTGVDTMTGGRVKRLKEWLKDDAFMLTYGDGVSDINLSSLLKYHKSHEKVSTVTAVKPEGRFGIMDFEDGKVISFREKLNIDENWINGGFFIFEPSIFDYIKSDNDELEGDVLSRLAEDGQLMAYRHEGFWSCMDTLKDKVRLEKIWQEGKAPWKLWR